MHFSLKKHGYKFILLCPYDTFEIHDAIELLLLRRICCGLSGSNDCKIKLNARDFPKPTFSRNPQPIFTYSYSIRETLDKGVKYVQR